MARLKHITSQIEESIAVKQRILNDKGLIAKIEKAGLICSEGLERGNKILLAGNGGSAADAQHIAGELVNRFGAERRGLSALSLTTDTSVLTSISNDYGFSRIIARQVEALGNKGDVLLVLSTSGNSENIIMGISEAKKKGLIIIGMTGKSGGKMKKLCDLIISVPSDDTPRIQESHIMAGHIICSLIEANLFGGK